MSRPRRVPSRRPGDRNGASRTLSPPQPTDASAPGRRHPRIRTAPVPGARKLHQNFERRDGPEGARPPGIRALGM